MLDELRVAHSATESILDKSHSVNDGKIYDFRLSDGSTIDLKTLPPCNSNNELKLNQSEAQNIGVCDYYVLYKCSGSYSEKEIEDMRALDERSARLAEKSWSLSASTDRVCAQSEFSQVRAKLHEYITRINKIEFITFVEGKDLVKQENVRSGKFGDYYSLIVPDSLTPPFHSYQEFAADILHATLL
jgi:hypothetical protein